mmetsp:Transcript_6031/g.6582  ORF Transcript_6031/g.6582 Transcript_6031/m.6582 type:complete len:822 (+) Transcript_6031:47-2512(+)
MSATLSTLVPLLHPLVFDPESIIRQHLASQLLPLSIVCMVRGMSPEKSEWPSVEEIRNNPSMPRLFVEAGYKVVTSAIVSHLHALIMDVDMDVRRAASESLAGLAPQIQRQDVGTVLVPIPVALSQETGREKQSHWPEGFPEELRITASHLLAELAGAAELDGQVPPETVEQQIWPAVRRLCKDPSFRVRRSAAQALPRVLGGTGNLTLAQDSILPAFEALARDDMYRVRKSTGECLVDMSRSLMLLAQQSSPQDVQLLKAMRREILIATALQLLGDSNKFVRHGMMQFLGPFIASFYPLEEGTLAHVLPTGSNTSESSLEHNPPLEGIGAQFFPHASSMVSRLNASGATVTSSPTPTPATLDQPTPTVTERQMLDRALPDFIVSNRLSDLTLHAVIRHCRGNPPDDLDIAAIQEELLQHFCALAAIDTGDDNTDAEMRVYCAYSYPAIVLLLGPKHWKGPLRNCFFSLVNSSKETPLPVKRCLASSLHTVAHVLGSELTGRDILPVFFEHFLMDTDDSVRLNVIRNFPHLLALLPPELRSDFLQKWKDLIQGQDLLGARKRRSATNPMLLNWRQRDSVSRSLPDLLSGLVSPTHVQKHVWPVLQALLVDSVSLVREDAEWSVPLLLRSFCSDLVINSGNEAKKWSAQVCQEVISWLKEAILGQKSTGKQGNFSHRQLYCRICAALGLALRFADLDPDDQWDYRYRGLYSQATTKNHSYIAYQSMSSTERKHLRRLLVYDLLPPALEFKTDRVTNVRLSLMKGLQEMPSDVKSLASVSEVLKELEDEVETWESFNAGSVESSQSRQPPPPPPPPREARASV